MSRKQSRWRYPMRQLCGVGIRFGRGTGVLAAFMGLVVLASPCGVSGADVAIDPALKPYAKVGGEVAGSLKCVEIGRAHV